MRAPTDSRIDMDHRECPDEGIDSDGVPLVSCAYDQFLRGNNRDCGIV
jgi:hypothetical protein